MVCDCARTTESQTHREMSSGLSSPVGFKNGTDGGLTVATNAMQSVKYGHSFLGLNEDGQVSIINTKVTLMHTWYYVAVMVNQTTMLALLQKQKTL